MKPLFFSLALLAPATGCYTRIQAPGAVGRVVDGDTGIPLRHARITRAPIAGGVGGGVILPFEGLPALTVVTDRNGRFEMEPATHTDIAFMYVQNPEGISGSFLISGEGYATNELRGVATSRSRWRVDLGNVFLRSIAVSSLSLGNQSAAAQVATPHGVEAHDSFAGSRPGLEREADGIRLCWCPPGTFVMGSPKTEAERRPDEDQVEVTLTKGFWMGKFETTQGDWRRVMGMLPGPLTAELPEGDRYPVGNVNFAEAEAFCRKLTEVTHQSGELPKDWEFRLPTEAQWEYACRAGTTTATSFGDSLSSRQANFKGKPYNGAEPGPSLHGAARVGSYPPNAWGLHDMHGNIYEWCRDWYHRKLPGGIDPDLYASKETATPSGNGDLSRSRRGGCWADDGWPLRAAFRLRFEPDRRYDHIGYRVVAVEADPQRRPSASGHQK